MMSVESVPVVEAHSNADTLEVSCIHVVQKKYKLSKQFNDVYIQTYSS